MSYFTFSCLTLVVACLSLQLGFINVHLGRLERCIDNLKGDSMSCKRLEVGDTIQCRDKEEMVKYMMALAQEGIDSDFLYEKDGKKGLWLVIIDTKIEGDKERTNEP